MANKQDIIIVGGGMVGLAMAVALAETDWQITVVEKQDFNLDEISKNLANQPISPEFYDIRVSAISPGNQRFLNKLGIWKLIPDSRRADYDWMKVWDADGSGKIAFDAAELAQPFLGSIVENQVLRAAAYNRLQVCSNVKVISGQTIDSIEPNNNKVILSLADGRRLTAKLLIGADGALSTVREHLGITCAQVPYQQTAFVANVKTEKSHENTAWQRFTRNGPVAFLPLPQQNLCSIVWSLDQDKAKTVTNMEAGEFSDKLAHAFERRLGEVELVSPFAGFPLVKRHSETYLSHRCALIGDAAHTIHPLAGQGVNLGFQDVACLSQQLLKLKRLGRDIGLVANLRPFERERKAENYLMQNAMSGFKWLFGHRAMPLTLLRNSAMSAVDSAGPIKRSIIKHAMGL